MIIRYCFIRLSPNFATDAGRAEAIAEARNLDTIAGIAVVAGVSADASAASWDLSIAVHAESMAMLNDATRTPTWGQFFEGYLGKRAAVNKAWNFATAAKVTSQLVE